MCLEAAMPSAAASQQRRPDAGLYLEYAKHLSYHPMLA